GFDARAPAFFSWLGVTMYLAEATVMSVLTTIAGLTPGSGIAFDYANDPDVLSDSERKVLERMAARVAAAGEPWTLFFDPARLGRSLQALGFTRVEDLDSESINTRYFNQRND